MPFLIFKKIQHNLETPYQKQITISDILFLALQACGILVPLPVTQTQAPTVKELSPNHWTARNFPGNSSLKKILINTESL